jgi:phosphopantetheine--protein transferase-like protein
VVGSITHNDVFCAAAVARDETMTGLGIDIDTVARFDTPLERTICTPGEIRRWLAPLADVQRQGCLAALFGVKEAFYKAQYSVSRAWLGFEDVEVTRMDAQGDGTTRVELALLNPPQPRPGSVLMPESAQWLTSRSWTGQFVQFEGYVLASFVLRDGPAIARSPLNRWPDRRRGRIQRRY